MTDQEKVQEALRTGKDVWIEYHNQHHESTRDDMQLPVQARVEQADEDKDWFIVGTEAGTRCYKYAGVQQIEFAPFIPEGKAKEKLLAEIEGSAFTKEFDRIMDAMVKSGIITKLD
tara:strand:+ start:148 stop:495 length:348 start_codon:yes stop_codon:yes gene_type:complete